MLKNLTYEESSEIQFEYRTMFDVPSSIVKLQLPEFNLEIKELEKLGFSMFRKESAVSYKGDIIDTDVVYLNRDSRMIMFVSNYRSVMSHYSKHGKGEDDEYSVDKVVVEILHDTEHDIHLKQIVSKLHESFKIVTIPKLHIITQTQYGFELKGIPITNPSIDLKINYGEGFEETYKDILLSLEKKKGIGFFYGKPGTGKTTLITYLIGELAEKKRVVYLPPDMTHFLTDPKFITFLLDYPDTILVIEDSENIISSRKTSNNQGVANLLNISDGLLSNALNLQIICTFNSSVEELDEALLRKGRCIFKHEFKELSIDSGKKVAIAIGKNPDLITEELTLAEIYNVEDASYVNNNNSSSKKIGFGN